MNTMFTKIVPISQESLDTIPERILSLRTMSDDEFINSHGSGTLRDNKALGFSYKMQCISERLAYVFGYGFTFKKFCRVQMNPCITECDEIAYTLAGRWTTQYKAKSLFSEDIFNIKYINIQENTKIEWSGIALIVEETSVNFLPNSPNTTNNFLIFAKIVEFDNVNNKWLSPINFA